MLEHAGIRFIIRNQYLIEKMDHVDLAQEIDSESVYY